jgi:hypothetical protein
MLCQIWLILLHDWTGALGLVPEFASLPATQPAAAE